MKKLITLFAVALMFLGATVKAQDFAGLIKGPTTHTNAMADTALVTIAKSRSAVTFKYDVNKTSGTVAGTIVTQVKLTTASGELWYTLYTDSLTDGTVSYYHTLISNPGLYYRIIATTSGTSVTVHNKYVLYRGFYPLQ